MSHRTQGNPFAKELIDFGQLSNNVLYLVPYTKPFEKIWFYNDLEGNMHGPFSSIEMFNWTARGFFPANLQISLSNKGPFIGMDVYTENENKLLQQP